MSEMFTSNDILAIQTITGKHIADQITVSLSGSWSSTHLELLIVGSHVWQRLCHRWLGLLGHAS